MSSLSYFATARRSACDRCKKQKLRCPPPPPHKAGQPCTRCAKADVPCVRGYTRPRGYAAKTAGHVVLGDDGPCHQASSSQTLQVGGALLGTPEARLLHDVPAADAAAVLDLGPTTGDPTGLLWFLANDDCQYLPPLDPHNIKTSSTTVRNGNGNGNGNDDVSVCGGFDRHPSPESYHCVSIKSFKHASTTCATPGAHNVSSNPMAGPHESNHQRQSHASNSTAPFWSMPQGTTDHDVRLCELNLSLCRQLYRQTHPCTPPSDATYVSDGPQGAGGMNGQQHQKQQKHHQEQVGSNSFGDAFGDALNSTEEYVAILEDLLNISGPSPAASSSSSPTGIPSSTRSNSELHDHSNLVCILNLESCYLRIVNLFNLHLANMQEHMQLRHATCSDDPDAPPPPSTTLPPSSSATSPAAPESPPVLPGLRLAGFLVRQAGLQAKILSQAIQHQFEMMERLLGLPARLRVSGCGDNDEDRCGVLCELWVTATSAMRERGACDEQLKAIELLRGRIVDTRQ